MTKEKRTKSPPAELLSETERQQEYLDDLPAKYEFPLFSGRQAVESQRQSAYKSTARAAREIIDNAVEAGAKNIWVIFERASERGLEKYQRKDAVTSIAFIDDGPGMVPNMVRYALTWGGGTHFKEPRHIGKFGFGLPNSSINQTRHVEVMSRAKAKDPWMVGVLDINDIPTHGLITIPPPTKGELPSFVQKFLERKKIKLETGTVVVWDKPDRLTYNSATALKEHLLDDFGVVYRELLGNFSLFLEDTKVTAVDPLFLRPGALFYKPRDQGGAHAQMDETIPVKVWRDGDVGIPRLEHLKDEDELAAARKDEHAVISTIHVRVARFPVGFVLGDKKFKGTEEYKRFEIRKPRRGMSFVRAGREIETVDIFPKSASDEASGLGDWPLLQTYAYHWGIEVSFGPELDSVFGIGHDKQTVRPVEDFWRVMTSASVDEAARAENAFQHKERDKDRKRKTQEMAENPDAPNPATDAAAQTEKLLYGNEPLPARLQAGARERLDQAVEEEAKKSGTKLEEAEQAIRDQAARKRYAIKFFESEGGVAFKPDLGNGLQRVVMINTAHPFYKVAYSKLIELGDPQAYGAVNLLLIALADAELRAANSAELAEMYITERENKWSPFLATSLRRLEQLEHTESEDEPRTNAGE